MAFNSKPLREISKEDKENYKNNGVVCLRKVFDPEWINSLIPMARKITVDEEDIGLLPSAPGRYMSRLIPEFRKFIFDSPMAQAAAEAIGSKTARFYFDEIFAKPPQSDSKTIWHCDRMGWPVSGVNVPSIWIPLNKISKQNCLEVLAGSHLEDVPYWLFSPNARKMIKPEDRASHPDEQKLRDNPDNEFLNWDMDIGDILVLHPWVLHYSSGNTANDWRIAISVRIFGDDIRWAPRPDCLNLAGVSFDEMVEGCPPTGPLFPLLWSEDGNKDTDDVFPKGFATTWQSHRRDTVNEDKLFNSLINKK